MCCFFLRLQRLALTLTMEDQFSSTQFWRHPLQRLTDADIFGVDISTSSNSVNFTTNLNFTTSVKDKNQRDPEDFEEELIDNQAGKMLLAQLIIRLHLWPHPL